MSFEMFAGLLKASIEHHEEYFLQIASENAARFPELTAIWSSFYRDPMLSPRQASALVHELIDLLAEQGGIQNKALAAMVIRLLPFFSAAYRTGQQISCSSD